MNELKNVIASQAEHTTVMTSQHSTRSIQRFRLVCLLNNSDEINSDDFLNTGTNLQDVMDTLLVTNVDECIDFITDIKEEKMFMIVSGTLSQIVIPIVQDIPQVSCIYIFCENKTRYEQWAHNG